MISLRINGETRRVEVSPDTPLLWVLRDHLGITSVKYACGVSECGVCTVLVDGEAVRSCSVTSEDVDGRQITTIEGLPDDHPVKIAWYEKQVPQCGYCQSGMMLQTAAFLSANPDPSREDIDASLDDFLCRCGSHPRAREATHLAAKEGGRP